MAVSGALVAALGIIAAACAVGAAVAVLRLHLLPTGVDPVREGVSAYALVAGARLYRAQVILCGVAAAAIAGACSLLSLGPPAGLLALVAYAVARFLIPRYPTDPVGSARLSASGRRHAALAAAAFLALAVAAPSVGLPLADAARTGAVRVPLVGLSVAVPITVGATFAAGGSSRLRPNFGLVERAFYAAALAWLAIAAIALPTATVP